MVLDQQRNDAYEQAISRAVAAKRAAGCRHVLALDVGAGSGLLSMMAARWAWAGRPRYSTVQHSVLSQGGTAPAAHPLHSPSHPVLFFSPLPASTPPPPLPVFVLTPNCSELSSPSQLPPAAPRAGADEVVAAEISQHMCDAGEVTVLANGYLGKITMLDRWVGGGDIALLLGVHVWHW